MTRGRDRAEPGVRKRRGQAPRLVGRRQGVLGAHHDQRGDAQAGQQGRGVRPVAHREQGPGHALWVRREDAAPDLRDEVRPLPARGLAEERGQDLVGQERDPLGPHARGQGGPALPARRGVRRGPGVREHEARHPLRGQGRDAEDHVSPHREPGEDRAPDASAVALREDLPRPPREVGVPPRTPPEPRQVRGQGGPAEGFRGARLRLPHPAVQGERVNEDHGVHGPD